MKKLMSALIFLMSVISALYAGSVINGQQEKGEIVLKSLSVADGKIIFRTDTGGCTDEKSFRVNVKQVKGSSYMKKPHYTLTIERVVPDYCKGLFPGGVVIGIDLEKDAGLKGDYTVSVTNMVYTQKGD